MRSAFSLPTSVWSIPFLPTASGRPHISRSFSSLSHVDEEGRARMVDVGPKEVTERRAVAAATVLLGPHICKLIGGGRMRKGDVLTVAQLAGVMAAKRTPELIPLCHTLLLDSVDVRLTLGESAVEVRCEAKSRGRTGVEMEALMGAAVAALTVYDMCKSASKAIRITDVRLVLKTGGKSDIKLKYNKEPITDKEETFAPTNFIYL